MRLRETPGERAARFRGYRERCFRAILSIGAQPPVKPLGFPHKWAVGDIVRDSNEAYGYTPERRKFHPTPADLDDMIPVLAAIALHKFEDAFGERDYKLILFRAYQQPWHEIRDRTMTDAEPRSLMRWLDRACGKIICERLPICQQSGRESA